MTDIEMSRREFEAAHERMNAGARAVANYLALREHEIPDALRGDVEFFVQAQSDVIKALQRLIDAVRKS
jgi:hypothetical protein